MINPVGVRCAHPNLRYFRISTLILNDEYQMTMDINEGIYIQPFWGSLCSPQPTLMSDFKA
jgi:hypothetical protein